MAAKDLDSDGNVKKQEVDDITTCCICTEVYTEPKALPCIHTFCMKCIQETGIKSNKRPGDEMPCPICRRLFKIPAEGFPGLPKHFFIERLIQVSKVSDPLVVPRAFCTLCLEESNEQEEKETPTADTYCVDCKYKLCEECCSEHKKFKMTKNHKLIPLNEYEIGQNAKTSLAPSACELHKQRVLDVFCADCKTVVCAICFIEEHNTHKGSHVDKTVAELRKHIESNEDVINECRSKAQMKQTKLLEVKGDMLERVGKLECDIANRTDELKELIDKHATSLLQGLSSTRQVKLKEIQMATDDVDFYILSLETYSSYCQKIIAKGSAGDICGAFSDLMRRSVELQQQCQPTIDRGTDLGLQSVNFSIRKSGLEEFLKEGCGNLIGEIEESQNIERQGKIKETEPKQEEYESKLRVGHRGIDDSRLKDLEAELLNITRNLDEERTLWAEERCQHTTQTQKMRQEILDSRDKMRNLQHKFEEEIMAWEEEKGNLIKEAPKLQKEYTGLKTELLDLKRNLDEERRLWAEERCQHTTQTQKMRQEISDSRDKMHNLQHKFEEERIAWEEEKEKLIKEAQKLQKEYTGTMAMYSEKPKLVKKIDLGHSVWGLAMLGIELFVASVDEMAIFVYDTVTYKLLRTIEWKGSRGPRDIAACQRRNCLFAVDVCSGLSLFCLNQKGKTLNKWDVYLEPRNLSVTSSGDILVTCNDRILIYKFDGDALKTDLIWINLKEFDMCWQTILLRSGNYLACQGWLGSQYHRVLSLNTKRVILKSFGSERKNSNSHLSDPVYMAIGRDEDIFVADSANNRVVLLSKELVFLRELVSKKDGIIEPCRVLLDEASELLYVGTNRRQLLIYNVFQ